MPISSNDLGNLAQRSLTMIGKQFGGALPKPGAFTDNDKTILAAADAMLGKAREAMKTQALHQVLNAVWAVVADANRYFAGRGPLGARQDRSGAAGHGALRHGGSDPAGRDPGPTVRARVRREVARFARIFRSRRATSPRSGKVAASRPERCLAQIKPVFPRYVEPEAKAG